jgi:hypothetical protein
MRVNASHSLLYSRVHAWKFAHVHASYFRLREDARQYYNASKMKYVLFFSGDEIRTYLLYFIRPAPSPFDHLLTLESIIKIEEYNDRPINY